MFGKLFSPKKFKSPTGVFKAEKESLIPIDVMPGNGSINALVLSLGYPTNHLHTVFTFDAPKIQSLSVKMFTQELVMVQLKECEMEISKDDVEKTINSIDWRWEYSSLNVEDILETGINEKNLSLDILRPVMLLSKEGENLYKSSQFHVYLQFENDILKSFTSADLENASTKWLKGINPQMVQHMLEEALKFQDAEFSAKDEVDKQTDALRNLPDGINNPYLDLHRSSAGNISFFNILITHYKIPCSIDGFKLMNKGRYQHTGNDIYKVGHFIYAFDEHGQLDNSTQIG